MCGFNLSKTFTINFNHCMYIWRTQHLIVNIVLPFENKCQSKLRTVQKIDTLTLSSDGLHLIYTFTNLNKLFVNFVHSWQFVPRTKLFHCRLGNDKLFLILLTSKPYNHPFHSNVSKRCGGRSRDKRIPKR